jgi:hypothetical protein
MERLTGVRLGPESRETVTVVHDTLLLAASGEGAICAALC